MKKVVVFGASNSKESINKRLAIWAANQIGDVTIEILDLNDYEMPIYSIDREQTIGIPDLALQFKEILRNADGILISFAEHNSNFSVAFKNIYDWVSRIERVVWLDKPMFLLATSPGGRGGASVLEFATGRFPSAGGKVVASYSLPSFNKNFVDGIVDGEIREEFDAELAKFKSALG